MKMWRSVQSYAEAGLIPVVERLYLRVVVQWLERHSYKVKVVGSSPTRPTSRTF